MPDADGKIKGISVPDLPPEWRARRLLNAVQAARLRLTYEPRTDELVSEVARDLEKAQEAYGS